MINREIIYERDVNRSYMKIPAIPEESFDEKIMLKRKIAGLLPVEKCYVNGAGQYWYNISGKQALDAYCRVTPVSVAFFENLMLRLCEQIEVLEWNLLDINCLVLDPELIFINHAGDEVNFVYYPYGKGKLFGELQQLMEYLLQRINHKDKEAVQTAYRVYEMTLVEGISIGDIKEQIVNGRMGTLQEPEEEISLRPELRIQEAESTKKEVPFTKEAVVSKTVLVLKEKVEEVRKKLRELLPSKEKEQVVIYPSSINTKMVEEEPVVMHPTICLNSINHKVRGVLVGCAGEVGVDYQLPKGVCMIGKNPRVQLQVNRDTVSQFHARIDYQNEEYYIEDLNSTNGTYINDVLLNYKERKQLVSNDLIRFADVSYRFY